MAAFLFSWRHKMKINFYNVDKQYIEFLNSTLNKRNRPKR